MDQLIELVGHRLHFVLRWRVAHRQAQPAAIPLRPKKPFSGPQKFPRASKSPLPARRNSPAPQKTLFQPCRVLGGSKNPFSGLAESSAASQASSLNQRAKTSAVFVRDDAVRMNCHRNNECLAGDCVLEIPLTIKALPQPRHRMVDASFLRLQFGFKHRAASTITDHRHRALAQEGVGVIVDSSGWAGSLATMPWQLRLQYPGALHHITAHGDRLEMKSAMNMSQQLKRLKPGKLNLPKAAKQ